MRILNFKYTNKKTIAVLESKKGTIFEASFNADGLEIYLPGNAHCPENIKPFVKEFLISKEVLDFYYNWNNSLTETQKWLGEKINKSLYELEKGEKYFPNLNFKQYRKKAIYRPHY